MDEYNLANSNSSYLVNSQIVWSLTPYDTDSAWRFSFNKNGSNYGIANAQGVRPVINLISSITISSGIGTIQDPFVIEDRNITGNLIEHSLIREYVRFAGRNYRVVETSSTGTKLILDGYYDTNNDGTIEETDKMTYGENCILCTTINEESFINWISNNNEIDKNKLVSTTWYRGDNFGYGGNYKNNLESISNPYEGRVGLIRVGEMLSGQIETIISKNHTVSSSYNNARNYWLMNSFSVTHAWEVYSDSYVNFTGKNSLNCIRPVIMIGPDVQITSGNGTFNEPFQI